MSADSGVVGGELVRFLLQHPDASWAWALVPGLVRLTPRVVEEVEARCERR
ncbi:hypothetical protein [Lentzea tibetensis]|uniref:hypothetical protein n=1 Tax=Lentzea tibetensis TaxID=2591470 RepID=UPI0016484619|nr:hypothetical protein [Lentzea tibetensis]